MTIRPPSSNAPPTKSQRALLLGRDGRLGGFSLTELLVVVAILAVLAGILFPIVAAAKLRAAKASCASNLHQAGIALSLYVESANGEYPQTWQGGHPSPAIAPILMGSKSNVLRCPLDVPEGRSYLPLVDRAVPISYKSTWLLWGYDSGLQAWKTLLGLDPNPILMRCYLHDDDMRRRMLKDHAERGALQNAVSLGLRKDGSVAMQPRGDHAPLVIDANGHATQNFKLDYWMNASQVPCPPDLCDGKMPPEVHRPH